jgi:hypothetical protein
MRPTGWTNPKNQKEGRSWRKTRREQLGQEEEVGETIHFNEGVTAKWQSGVRSLVNTGQFNGTAGNCLIDTGSVVSLMFHAVYQ